MQLVGDDQHCLECGYRGRADRGGKLSAQEVGALYEPTKDPHDLQPW